MFILFMLVLIVLLYLLQGYPLYRLGQIARYDNAWFGFVPILNTILMHDLAFGVKLRKRLILYFVLSFLSGFIMSYSLFIGYVLYFVVWGYTLFMCVKFVQNYQQSWIWGVLLPIPVINLIVYYILIFKVKNYNFE